MRDEIKELEGDPAKERYKLAESIGSSRVNLSTLARRAAITEASGPEKRQRAVSRM